MNDPFKVHNYAAEEQRRITVLVECICGDPEVLQGVSQLVRSLESNQLEQRGEDFAWKCFDDRIAAVISRYRNALVKINRKEPPGVSDES